MSRSVFSRGVAALCFGLCLIIAWRWHANPHIFSRGVGWLPSRMERPRGMAPVAFRAYVLACSQTRIHPFRVGQTVGDHPRSHGYHLADGTIPLGATRESYTTAVDLGVPDLTPARRAQFLENLARCGFAAFYRQGPRWRGNEHIHAIYAGLPMKPQLRQQIREWETLRRRTEHKRYRWQRKWRRFWRF